MSPANYSHFSWFVSVISRILPGIYRLFLTFPRFISVILTIFPWIVFISQFHAFLLIFLSQIARPNCLIPDITFSFCKRDFGRERHIRHDTSPTVIGLLIFCGLNI